MVRKEYGNEQKKSYMMTAKECLVWILTNFQNQKAQGRKHQRKAAAKKKKIHRKISKRSKDIVRARK